MYKSIYEEALEKIDVEFDAWDRAEHLELLQLVEHVLEKAQQQEKLLELYKEINNKRRELITLARYNTWSWKLDIEIKEIQDKIDKLLREDDMNSFFD